MNSAHIKNTVHGTSLVVQWLRLCTSNAGGVVPSLLRELRSHRPCGRGQKKKKEYSSINFPGHRGVPKNTEPLKPPHVPYHCP